MTWFIPVGFLLCYRLDKIHNKKSPLESLKAKSKNTSYLSLRHDAVLQRHRESRQAPGSAQGPKQFFGFGPKPEQNYTCCSNPRSTSNVSHDLCIPCDSVHHFGALLRCFKDICRQTKPSSRPSVSLALKQPAGASGQGQHEPSAVSKQAMTRTRGHRCECELDSPHQLFKRLPKIYLKP